jgi:transposase InsO family protein
VNAASTNMRCIAGRAGSPRHSGVALCPGLDDRSCNTSVGTAGDSHYNALAETINGLDKAEVVHRRSWRTLQDVELATLEWVH